MSALEWVEVESLEQELFKHQPVLSMRDGSVAGCQCSDRVFHKRTEDWGTHLAEVFVALSLPSQPVYDEGAIARAIKKADEKWYAEPDIAGRGVTVTAWSKYLAAALVAALQGGELTREETNDG